MSDLTDIAARTQRFRDAVRAFTPPPPTRHAKLMPKADLVGEARLHENDFTPTNNGGSRWTATGTDGCIARVNFPAPALMPLINSESETFDQVLALAGECVDRLFESVYYLRPVPEFREEVSQALPKRDARQLIELCETKCTPRVSFETAETKTA